MKILFKLGICFAEMFVNIMNSGKIKRGSFYDLFYFSSFYKINLHDNSSVDIHRCSLISLRIRVYKRVKKTSSSVYFLSLERTFGESSICSKNEINFLKFYPTNFSQWMFLVKSVFLWNSHEIYFYLKSSTIQVINNISCEILWFEIQIISFQWNVT